MQCGRLHLQGEIQEFRQMAFNHLSVQGRETMLSSKLWDGNGMKLYI